MIAPAFSWSTHIVESRVDFESVDVWDRDAEPLASVDAAEATLLIDGLAGMLCHA